MLLFASSCRPLLRQVFKKPKVQVVSIGIAGNPFNPSREPLEAIINLSVQNPNSYALTVSQAVYTVIVGKQLLASGERPEEIRIEPSGETLVRVPVSLDTNAFSAALQDLIEARSVPYEFNGSLAVDAPLVGIIHVPFSKKGAIDPMDLLRKKGIRFN